MGPQNEPNGLQRGPLMEPDLSKIGSFCDIGDLVFHRYTRCFEHLGLPRETKRAPKGGPKNGLVFDAIFRRKSFKKGPQNGSEIGPKWVNALPKRAPSGDRRREQKDEEKRRDNAEGEARRETTLPPPPQPHIMTAAAAELIEGKYFGKIIG